MRTNNGAIQISRSIFDSKIWSKPPEWFKIRLYILGNVNYKDTQTFPRGTNFFKYDIIALECQCSINVVNKCVKFLKEAEQIQNSKSSRGAIITVVNYDKYQTLDNYSRTEAEQKQNRSSTSTNTIKEERKKERKKEIYIGELEDLLKTWNELFDVGHKITPDLKKTYSTQRKVYSYEDIIQGCELYYEKNKNNIKDVEWKNKYYLTLSKFITQKKNGFVSYL